MPPPPGAFQPSVAARRIQWLVAGTWLLVWVAGVTLFHFGGLMMGQAAPGAGAADEGTVETVLVWGLVVGLYALGTPMVRTAVAVLVAMAVARRVSHHAATHCERTAIRRATAALVASSTVVALILIPLPPRLGGHQQPHPGGPDTRR